MRPVPDRHRRPMHRSRAFPPIGLVAAAILVVQFQTPASFAQTKVQRLGEERPQVVERWRQTLAEADRLQAAGEWKRVRKMMNRLLTEMSGRIESGDLAANLLAAAAAQRGIAQAGLGNERDALWDWEMAVALDPAFAGLSLDDYGQAGARLGRLRDAAPHEDIPSPPDAVMEPPRRRRSTVPEYPYAKSVACLEEAIQILAIIDRDGLIQRPRLASPDDPVLGFAAMDVLRSWRYKPARLDGRPITVELALKVNFRIPLCRNLMAIREQARDQ